MFGWKRIVLGLVLFGTVMLKLKLSVVERALIESELNVQFAQL